MNKLLGLMPGAVPYILGPQEPLTDDQRQPLARGRDKSHRNRRILACDTAKQDQLRGLPSRIDQMRQYQFRARRFRRFVGRRCRCGENIPAFVDPEP